MSSPTWSVTVSWSSAASSSGVKWRPGGRRRRRAGIARVDGLVALGVGGRLVDVRRQRQLAVRLALEPHDPPPLPERLDELDGRRGAGVASSLARAEAARRSRERLPEVRPSRRSSEEHLDLASRRATDVEPRRDDPRVVDHRQVGRRARRAGRQTSGVARAAPPVEHEQPGRVAPLGRPLGDELRPAARSRGRLTSSDGERSLGPWTNRH